MRFKSDAQRKAVMSSLRGQGQYPSKNSVIVSEKVSQPKLDRKYSKVSSEIDTEMVREGNLLIENDENVYRQQLTPTYKNLVNKMFKGEYDSVKADKGFLNIVTDWERKNREQNGYTIPLSERLEMARELRKSFEQEARLGNYNNLLNDTNKKIAKKEGWSSLENQNPQRVGFEIMYSNTPRKLSVADIRARHKGNFFDKGNKKFFGDNSYNTYFDKEEEKNYLIIKRVNPYSKKNETVRYEFNEKTGDLTLK